MNTRHKDQYIVTTINNWTELVSMHQLMFLQPFVFRGQQDKSWPLDTSLERAFKKHETHFIPGVNTQERIMIDEFSKKAHLYSDYIPKSKDRFEWLAIMQHYGAPTRLLDFTQSLYIAIYFAIIDSTETSVVWAINRWRLDDKLKDYKKSHDEENLSHNEFANKYIGIRQPFPPKQDIPSLIVPLEPKLSTNRLARQQGLFLMPTNTKVNFMDNLEKSFNIDNSEFIEVEWKEFFNNTATPIRDFKAFDLYEEKYEYAIIKFLIPNNMKKDILTAFKKMNITSEILFPGLEGLAKSLIQTNFNERLI